MLKSLVALHDCIAAQALAEHLMEAPLTAHERRIIREWLQYALDGTRPRRSKSSPQAGVTVKANSDQPGSEDRELAA